MTRMLEENDPEILEAALIGIGNILAIGDEGEECENELLIDFEALGGRDRLEELIVYPNVSVFKKAKAIIEKCYPTDELEEIYKFKEIRDKLIAKSQTN